MNLVGTSTASNGWVVGNPYQRYTFFAVGRYWCFYTSGANMGWKTSIDGILWTAFTNIRAATRGYHFCFAFDGTNFHYCYSLSDYGAAMYYRMGTANADGTITWLAAEQTALAVDANHRVNDPSISIDSNGYPWIAYGYTTTVTFDAVAYVHKSKTKNGTWTDENVLFASPYQFSASTFNAGNPNPVPWCFAVPLTSGKMYAIATTDGNNTVGGAEKNTKGRLWDSAAWAAEETCVTSNTIGSADICAVNSGDDVHLTIAIFTTYPTDLTLYHYKRTYGVGWGAGAVVRVHPTNQLKHAVLSIDNVGTLYCFWGDEPVAKHFYYKRCVAGVWDINPTDWFTETDAITVGVSPVVSSQVYNGVIILASATLVASPYNYKMATLVVENPWTAVSQVTANLDDIGAYWPGVWASLNDRIYQDCGYYNNAQWKWGGGMRFTGITLPFGATVTKAYLDLVCGFIYHNGVPGVVRSVIIGQKSNNAAQFSDIADYQARRGVIVGGANDNNITTASVLWNNIPTWAVGDIVRSPDIKTIIQELVNLYGGLAMANIVIFWDDHGDNSDHTNYTIRDAWSHDGSATLCPVLYIEYTLPLALTGVPLAQKLVASRLI